ncbi:peptidylprolyl isomerase [Salinisphaera aquimarina]|uniref:Peptidyl-prolyl cis-trans isomerase n=1 Tax=Salinisphaera aquimarina TaxID=2094031 RepID=A0ABV7EUL1_9GAMM
MKHLLRLTAFTLLFSVAFAANSATGDAGNSNKEDPMVVMHTNLGDITIEVFEDEAPKSAANFIQYVKDGFYDGIIFHRVIPGFVIQGGGFDENYKQKKTRDPIVNESDNGLDNDRGTLSMARTNDPDSATSQFFVNLSDNAPLNAGRGRPGYAVFGKVTDGMDVVDKIAAGQTGAAGPFRQDVPQDMVTIESAEVIAK